MTRIEQIVRGINILSKYPDCDMAAEHDEIWFGPNDPDVVSEEDKAELETLGWYVYDGMGWKRFV